jgi:hypothetical protein
MRAGDLVLAGVDVAAVADNAELWEKVVRKLRNGLMPPGCRTASMPPPRAGPIQAVQRSFIA